MAKKKHTTESIINFLRKSEVELNEGKTLLDICRNYGVSNKTYYRWRKEYGGLNLDKAKKLKDLEKENSRLKRLVADLSLDKAMLQEVAEGNF